MSERQAEYITHGLDYFDRVTVINLQEFPGPVRWAETLAEFRRVGWTHPVNQFVVQKAAGDYRARHQSASISHFACIEQAKREGRRNVLVLEDDVQFMAFDQIPAILSDLVAVEWDMFYLGCNVCGPMEIMSDHLARLSNARAMHAYAVNARYFDGFLKLRHGFLEQSEELDTILCNRVLPSIRAYVGIPLTAIQRPSYSSILGKMVDYSHLPAKYDRWMKEAKK